MVDHSNETQNTPLKNSKIEENPPSEQASSLSSENKQAAPKTSRSRALWLFTLLLVIVALSWFCYWFFYLRFYESTDDAYANGNFININSVIPGAVVAYFADNTDLVKEGQLLVQLDPLNYRLAYEKELATLASVALQVKQLYQNVTTNKANVENKRNILERAKYDYESRLKLQINYPKAVAEEDFVHAKQDYAAAEYDFLQTESELAKAKAAAGNTEPEYHPLIQQQKENILIAFYNLEHCNIYAPSTGYVAQRTVDVGQWVTPTVNLMAIIPTDYVWVDANFKETQLSEMRVGQSATVWFDLYGSKVEYKGQVIGIASGSGSVFSLIPPQNATGNWIKIVQRLPVRISLDPEVVKKFPVRLGISAEVTVDITNQDLPFLSPIPVQKPVAKTNVFELDLEKVHQLMDQIIQNNLEQK